MAHLETDFPATRRLPMAMRQIDPDVMGAFPITPSTEIPQYFAQYVADGKVTHRVRDGGIRAQLHVRLHRRRRRLAAGPSRATSSCGLALMYELLYVAASSRLPIALAVSTRALSGPININNDHSDAMGARDAGWIQIYAENNQEAYDNYVQAVPHRRARCAAAGDDLSWTASSPPMRWRTSSCWRTSEVKDFVGEYQPEHSLLKAGETTGGGPLRRDPLLFRA